MKASPMSRGTLALAILALWGCANDRQESTEVENEVAARRVEGSAMDSAALDSAAWTLQDSTGAVLAQGATDSVGGFSATLSRSPVGVLLATVVREGDTLRALVPLDTSTVRGGTATVLVHSLTEAALADEIATTPSRGISAELALRVRRRGQGILDTGLGIHLPWNRFASDPSFRPVAPEVPCLPTPLSGFLRALDLRAAREGLRGSAWLARRAEHPGPALGSDSLFALDLASSLAALRLPQDQTGDFAASLDQASALDGNWLEVWQSRQVFPNPEELTRRVPWASRREFLPIWTRLVQATGDSAAGIENRLPPEMRRAVPPGRAHEILVEAMGKVVVPDSSILGLDSRTALDALLGQLVPQSSMMLEQVDPLAWGPASSPSGPPPPPPDPDPMGSLLERALMNQLPKGWRFPLLAAQTDPAGWMSQNYLPWHSPAVARDSLKSLISLHPEWKFSSPPIP